MTPERLKEIEALHEGWKQACARTDDPLQKDVMFLKAMELAYGMDAALPELLAMAEENARIRAEAEFLRPEVRAFARHMEQALRCKDGERGGNSWQSFTPPDEILPHLQERTERIEGYLKTAKLYTRDEMIEQMHLDSAAEQAVHAANFAMMIADICNPLACAALKEPGQ